ncbi:p23/wos2 family protein [Streptomyces abikoensis]
MNAKTRHPNVLWAQAGRLVYLTVVLHDVSDDSIELQSDAIDFKNVTDGVEYAFHLDFYAPIDVGKSKWSISDRGAFLVLTKQEEGEMWTRLTKEKVKPDFVKIDFTRWADEDAEDHEDFSQHEMEGGDNDAEEFEDDEAADDARNVDETEEAREEPK